MVLLYVPAIYIGGAAAVRYTADLDDEEWSRDPANTVAARAVCTDSSTAPLGDRPADRDTFEDALFAVMVAAAVAVGGYLLQAGLDRCGRLSDRKKAVAVSIIAALVTLTHLVVTLLLCLGVLVGTNPVCAHATLADNRRASWGFAVLGYVLLPLSSPFFFIFLCCRFSLSLAPTLGNHIIVATRALPHNSPAHPHTLAALGAPASRSAPWRFLGQHRACALQLEPASTAERAHPLTSSGTTRRFSRTWPSPTRSRPWRRQA